MFLNVPFIFRPPRQENRLKFYRLKTVKTVENRGSRRNIHRPPAMAFQPLSVGFPFFIQPGVYNPRRR